MGHSPQFTYTRPIGICTVIKSLVPSMHGEMVDNSEPMVKVELGSQVAAAMALLGCLVD